MDDDDKITREELLAVLHMMVGANISSDQVSDRGSDFVDDDRDFLLSLQVSPIAPY